MTNSIRRRVAARQLTNGEARNTSDTLNWRSKRCPGHLCGWGPNVWKFARGKRGDLPARGKLAGGRVPGVLHKKKKRRGELRHSKKRSREAGAGHHWQKRGEK